MNTSINQDANAVANFQRRGIYNKYQQEKNSIQEIDLQARFFSFSFFSKNYCYYQYIGFSNCDA